MTETMENMDVRLWRFVDAPEELRKYAQFPEQGLYVVYIPVEIYISMVAEEDTFLAWIEDRYIFEQTILPTGDYLYILCD